MVRRGTLPGLVLMIVLIGAPAAGSPRQTDFAARLENALQDAQDGTIRLSCAVSEEAAKHHRVCYGGDRRQPVVFGDPADERLFIAVEHRDGRVRDLETWTAVGWRYPCDEVGDDCVDLGEMDPGQASAWFLALARGEDGRRSDDVAEEALLAAVLARGADIARLLIDIARDRDQDEELRESAMMWLAIFAGDQAAGPLQELTLAEQESADLRESAVVALAQLDDDRALPILMDLARGHRHPEVQHMALIMLARVDTPEVLDLLEDLLRE